MSALTFDGLRDLSDEDVKLLYDIVTAAEASRAPPFRALFAAYERELAKRGISKDHDQLYLRFLLRMGENRKEGCGLYDQFESLLSKLGFQVAFDGEDKENEGEQQTDDEQDQSTSAPRINLLQTQPFRPSRRASFDSAFGNTTDTKPLPALLIRPRSIDGLSRLSAQHGQSSDKSSSESANIYTRSRDGVKAIDHGSRLLPEANKSISYGPKAGDEPHESDETLAEDSKSFSEYSASDVSNEVPEIVPEAPAASNDLRSKVAQPLENIDLRKRQLDANAKTLKYHHVAARAVHYFRRWSDSATKARDDHDRMYKIAVRHDANILVYQAFDQWCLVLHEKRQRRETETFFKNLETRAGKAREMFLLTKSFTHWAQCASEETMRRSAARKLILQTRYFNAWRDITVVNELKARRLCLSKFFSKWIKRTELVFDNEDQAAEVNAARSMQYGYRQWFWAFCERRTPSWYMSKRKDTIFKKWLGLAREAMIRKAWALDFRNLELVRSSISQWTRRSGLVLQHHHDAGVFRRRALLVPNVENLRRELELAPRQHHVVHVSAWRVARSAFYVWITKARDIRAAARTNELRMMKNAWTQWNDSLRCRALSRVINDRISVQALYNWVLAERLVLCERAKADDLRKSVFTRWRNLGSGLSTRLSRSEDLVVRSRDRRTVSSILKTWSARSQVEQHEELRATSFRSKRLVSESFNSWSTRFRHSTKLEKWSEEARFFVLASRSIKTWHTTTVASKRNRRRDAFASFRRMAKSTTTKRIMDHWSHASHSKSQLGVQGMEVQQQRLMAKGTSLFDNWRERISVIQLYEEEAGMYRAEHALKRAMQIWISRLGLVQESESRASEYAHGMIDAGAAASLRKLNWRAFQLKRQDESAESLLRRNRKKHYRHMLRYWASITTQRQQMRQSTLEDQQHIDPPTDRAIRGSAFARQRSPWLSRTLRQNESQSMSRLDIPRMSQGPSAVTPGYLRTPSRRPTLSKARVQASTLTQPRQTESQPLAPTTPSTARITPFMNRLRAQYPTSSLASGFRSARGDFTARLDMDDVRNAGFEDIPESPLLDHREPEE